MGPDEIKFHMNSKENDNIVGSLPAVWTKEAVEPHGFWSDGCGEAAQHLINHVRIPLSYGYDASLRKLL